MSWTRATTPVILALVASACSLTIGAPPAPEVVTAGTPGDATVDVSSDDPGGVGPAGEVRVAYPDPVTTWWQRDEEDLAAGDLASLWMLPLYRVDARGRLVPGLAADARTGVTSDGGWQVEIDLTAGSWSDGSPVTATDVVATADALALARPAAWGAYTGASAVDADTVALQFDREFAGWPWLLSVAPGVLPAAVLGDGGLAAYADDVPVSGGWFRLTEREPELRNRFEAHDGSPLGAPGLEAVDVFVVPDHETSLGLLDRDEVDVVLGYVALDAPTRREPVAGVIGAEVFGGTRFELLWEADGRSDLEDRRAAVRATDPVPLVQGLLRETGRRPGGIVPQLLWAPVADGDATADGELAVQLPRTVEGLGLLARLLQSDLQTVGADVELVRLDPPQDVLQPVDVDGRLRIVRVVPGRSAAGLLGALGMDIEPGLAADAAGLAGIDPVGPPTALPDAWRAAHDALSDDPRLRPLGEVAVTHVWRPTSVDGVEPSGWTGVGLWNVGEWRLPAP